MRITWQERQYDDIRWASRNVKEELAYCSLNMTDRTSIRNDDLHFYAWLFRAALRMIEKLENRKSDKKGKWERHYSRPGVYADLNWWCSCCEKPTSYRNAGIFYEFCPHCGAKLDKADYE